MAGLRLVRPAPGVIAGEADVFPSEQGEVTSYWLRVSGVARVREHARSGEDPGLSRRCDGFIILCVRSRSFIIPSPCEITTRSAPSQFGTGFLVDASRSGVR